MGVKVTQGRGNIVQTTSDNPIRRGVGEELITQSKVWPRWQYGLVKLSRVDELSGVTRMKHLI